MSITTSKRLLFFSIIGVLVGLSATITFSVLENWSASFWAFLSALFAAINCQLHILHIKDQLRDWHSVETLFGIKFLGFTSFIISLGWSAWYTFIFIYHHLPMLPVKDSVIISLVWALMTAKWGGLLHLSAARYTRILLDPSDPPLLSHI